MKNLIVLVALLLTSHLSAQTDCPCCDEFHQQFDFWVGSWIVSDTTGKEVGSNEIVKIENGCALTESWLSSQGVTGSSMNFFDPSDSTWNQVWIDNSGGVIKLKGHFINDQMVLKSDIIKGKKVNYFSQISWSKNEDGSVTQLWQVFSEEGKLLSTPFEGVYRKVD